MAVLDNRTTRKGLNHDGPGHPLIGAMLAHETGSGVDCAVFTRRARDWAFIGTVQADKFSAAEMLSRPAVAGDHESLRMIVHATKAFLSALHCSNVQRQEHTPDAKLQKAHSKRGKASLFSYWTLQLNGNSERGENKGDTHATPRVHLVRGHPRQYAPDRWTWVQAHARGNKAIGVVHKDYSAGPALAAH